MFYPFFVFGDMIKISIKNISCVLLGLVLTSSSFSQNVELKDTVKYKVGGKDKLVVQTRKLSNFIYGGPSIPVGEFGSKKVNSRRSGLANIGAMVGFQHEFNITKHFDLFVSCDFAYNPADKNTLKAFGISSSTGYKSLWLSVGPRFFYEYKPRSFIFFQVGLGDVISKSFDYTFLSYSISTNLSNSLNLSSSFGLIINKVYASVSIYNTTANYYILVNGERSTETYEQLITIFTPKIGVFF